MRTLVVKQQTFVAILSGLIQSGVTFEAHEDKDGDIVITFTGGY